MSELSVQEKVQTAASFLLESPPGEVNDVFNGAYLFLLQSRSRSGLSKQVNWFVITMRIMWKPLECLHHQRVTFVFQLQLCTWYLWLCSNM